MVEPRYRKKDGSPVEHGICIMPDVWEQTFTVVVRSQTPVNEGRLAALLATKFDADVKLTDSVCTVR